MFVGMQQPVGIDGKLKLQLQWKDGNSKNPSAEETFHHYGIGARGVDYNRCAVFSCSKVAVCPVLPIITKYAFKLGSHLYGLCGKLQLRLSI